MDGWVARDEYLPTRPRYIGFLFGRFPAIDMMYYALNILTTTAIMTMTMVIMDGFSPLHPRLTHLHLESKHLNKPR
jgi:hypothetical protein